MPTYRYKCNHCGREFEDRHSILDDDPRECPNCGWEASKVISLGGGFILKGNGFYANDYSGRR